MPLLRKETINGIWVLIIQASKFWGKNSSHSSQFTYFPLFMVVRSHCGVCSHNKEPWSFIHLLCSSTDPSCFPCLMVLCVLVHPPLCNLLPLFYSFEKLMAWQDIFWSGGFISFPMILALQDIWCRSDIFDRCYSAYSCFCARLVDVIIFCWYMFNMHVAPYSGCCVQ